MDEELEKLLQYHSKPTKYYRDATEEWLFGHLLSFDGLGKLGEGFFCPIKENNKFEAIWVNSTQLTGLNNIELYLYT